MKEKNKKDAEKKDTSVQPSSTTEKIVESTISKKVEITTEATESTKRRTTTNPSVPLDHHEHKVEPTTKKSKVTPTMKAPMPESPNHILRWFFGKTTLITLSLT